MIALRIINILLFIEVLVLWHRVMRRLEDDDDLVGRDRFYFSPATVGEFLNDAIRWLLSDKAIRHSMINVSSIGIFSAMSAVISLMLGVTSFSISFAKSISITPILILTIIQLIVALDAYVKLSKGLRCIFALILYIFKLIIIIVYGVLILPALILDDIFTKSRHKEKSKTMDFIKSNITITNVFTN